MLSSFSLGVMLAWCLFAGLLYCWFSMACMSRAGGGCCDLWQRVSGYSYFWPSCNILMLWLTFFFFLHLCISVQLVCQLRDKHLKNEVEPSFYCGSAINFALKTVTKFNPSCDCYRLLGTTAVPPQVDIF